jgi:hypothetical protein
MGRSEWDGASSHIRITMMSISLADDVSFSTLLFSWRRLATHFAHICSLRQRPRKLRSQAQYFEMKISGQNTTLPHFVILHFRQLDNNTDWRDDSLFLAAAYALSGYRLSMPHFISRIIGSRTSPERTAFSADLTSSHYLFHDRTICYINKITIRAWDRRNIS